VYVPSGRYKATTEAIVGTQALSFLQRFNFTKAFVGTNGVSLDKGYTTPGIEEVEVKSQAIRSAYQSWILADESKFGKIYAAVICSLGDCSVITNRLPNPAYRQHTTVKETELL
jgi:DeoR family fructose operon transcriptional repressor